jgi:hypothetical protein
VTANDVEIALKTNVHDPAEALQQPEAHFVDQLQHVDYFSCGYSRLAAPGFCRRETSLTT